MPKIDLDAIPLNNSTGYPPPHDQPVQGRWKRAIGQVGGITEFGVNHVVLKPGAWSSQRHWHEGEDEFAVMIAGEATLVDDHGRTPLKPGDCLAFPKNDGNGHHIVNDGEADCIFIAIGRQPQSACHYSDIDMMFDWRKQSYFHKDGTAF
jgi:uncharacterized cupin superfamily protein